jgi:hypothetical protein
MNGYFIAAAVISALTGLVHTVMGEVLIFRRMRRAGFIPTDGGGVLHERHVRIIWATWHALSVFGWGMAALLVWLASEAAAGGSFPVAAHAIAASALAGSLLVLVGTRGRHPGWIALLGTAALVWIGGAVGPP